MKKGSLVILFFVVFAGTTAILTNQAYTKSSGAPLANTGSPGDGSNNTCAKLGCHVGTVNSFSGNVNVDLSGIPAAGYRPGETYSITVTVAENNKSTFGYQLTAEDPSGNKAGTFIQNTASRIEMTNWITHRTPNGTGIWTVDWTAPASGQTITFYAAGNAANSDGKAGGDHIYTSSASVSKDVFAAVESPANEEMFQVYSAFDGRELFVESDKKTVVYLYTLNGILIQTHSINEGLSSISLADLTSGGYILSAHSGAFSKRIIVP